MNACQPFEDRLALLAGGDLSEEEAASLRLHVPTCEGCRRALVEVREAIAWARQARTPGLDDADRTRLRRAVVAEIENRRPAPVWWARLTMTFSPRSAGDAGWRPGGVPLAAVPAVLALVAVVWGIGGRQTEDHRAPVAPNVGGEEILLARAEPEMPDEPRPLKIELRTKDPKIRIVWLARP